MATDIKTPLIEYLTNEDLKNIILDKSLLDQTRELAKRELLLREPVKGKSTNESK
jgi:hypothetical protein